MSDIPIVHADRIVERYWLAIGADVRADIEAAIEPGDLLRMTAGHPGQPGTATVRLLRDGKLVAEARGTLTASLVRSVLAKAATA